MIQVRRSLAQNDSSSTLDKPDDKSGDKCDDKSDLKSGDKSDDKADFTSDDKSDDKSNDKADDKSNDKSNDKSDDIHPIRSHNNKGGGLRPPPQKRWRGLRPRHLFCGFLCIGFEYGKYRSGHHNTCLACR